MAWIEPRTSRDTPSSARGERMFDRLGLVAGLALLLALVAGAVVALALGLDESSFWRVGAGRWLIGIGGLAVVVGAAWTVRKHW